jgi:5-(carboxyamino)imidazole ribonucleotide synthase
MFNGKKIKVLGGGQLGRMLIQEALNWNADISFLDPDSNAPCKNLTAQFTCGSLTDFDTVMNFANDANIVTIEIEHVNVDALEALERSGKEVYPQPHILRMIQDKGSQKLFYREHGIPTADFELIENKQQLAEHRNAYPFMMKLRKGGYDGKGVTPLRNETDENNAFDAPSVLEKFVDFEKELSVIVARNKSGEVKSFPAVEMEFNKEANLVEFLFAPANISKEIEQEAERVARLVAEQLGIVGVLAVEMFLTKEGKILVNEIAPRPHNSGHHTIEANYTSQYEQHLRAICNLPLGNTDIILPAVMINVLGEKNYEGVAKYERIDECLAIPGVYIHLYGKKITKPFRKMGHVTIIDANLSEAKAKARRVQQTLKVIS